MRQLFDWTGAWVTSRWARISRADRDSDRGDVPGWVMVTVMTAILVVAILGVFEPAIKSAITNAINNVSWRRWWRRCGRLGRDRGAAIAEFVMISVLLIFLLFAVLQVAILLYVRTIVAASAADGARYAASSNVRLLSTPRATPRRTAQFDKRS